MGNRDLLIAKSALLWTCVVAVAELLPGVASVVVLDTLAVLVMVVPFAVPAVTFTTTVKILDALAASVGLVKVKVPVPPAGTNGGRLIRISPERKCSSVHAMELLREAEGK